MENLKYIIYKVENKINGKLYIGKTTKGLEYRKKKHISNVNTKNKLHYPIYNALRKYGEENFTWSVIDSDDSEDLLNLKEIYWIEELNTKTPNGYNLTDGGDGVSGSTGAIPWNKGLKTGNVPWNKGMKMSDEFKEKVSASLVGRDVWNKGMKTGQEVWNKGVSGYKIHSEENKRNVGLRSRGTKNNFAKLTEENVLQIKNMILNGVQGKDLAEMFNVSRSNISAIKNSQTWTHLNKEQLK